MTKILFVCHGNICRSTMAEFVMRDIAEKNNADILAESAATSTEEIGNPPHRGTKKKLAEHGISCEGKYARQLSADDYEKYDYIIGMDSYNIRNILRIVGDDRENKVKLLLEFAGSTKSIADPWYTGNFDETYGDVLLGCKALFEHITGYACV